MCVMCVCVCDATPDLTTQCDLLSLSKSENGGMKIPCSTHSSTLLPGVCCVEETARGLVTLLPGVCCVEETSRGLVNQGDPLP